MNALSKKLIADWDMESLSEQERIDFIDRVSRLVYQAVLVRSLDILSVVEQEELDRLLDVNSTTPEDVFVFLDKKIPTFHMLVKDEVEAVKQDVLV